jgi:hypothetical protein
VSAVSMRSMSSTNPLGDPGPHAGSGRTGGARTTALWSALLGRIPLPLSDAGCALAFLLVSLAHDPGMHALLPWEATGCPVTPQQVRRVMLTRVSQDGTPIRACHPRGKAPGRAKGFRPTREHLGEKRQHRLFGGRKTGVSVSSDVSFFALNWSYPGSAQVPFVYTSKGRKHRNILIFLPQPGQELPRVHHCSSGEKIDPPGRNAPCLLLLRRTTEPALWQNASLIQAVNLLLFATGLCPCVRLACIQCNSCTSLDRLQSAGSFYLMGMAGQTSHQDAAVQLPLQVLVSAFRVSLPRP